MALQVGELFAKLGLEDKEFHNKLGQASQAFNRMAGSFSRPLGFLSNMLSTAGGFLTANIISGLAGQFSELTGAMVGGNAEFETVGVQFEAMMGSADAAQQHLAMLAKFAKDTPFDMPEIAQASRLLQVFGGSALNNVENLTLVGNAAAIAGRKYDEVAFWVGRTYDALQSGRPFGEAAAALQEMGVLSGSARAKVEALQEAGKSGPEVWDAFTKAINAPASAMDKLSETFDGMRAAASDNIAAIGREAGAPLFELGKKLLAAFNSDAVQARLSTLAASVASTLGRVISWVTGTAVPGLTRAWAAIAPAAQAAVNAMARVFEMLAAIGSRVFGYGAGVGQQYGAGIISSITYVADAIGAIARVITYWLQPHSPPKILPNLDTWGQGAAQAWLDGWATADDYSALNELGGTIQQLIQSFVDLGQGDEAGVIPAVLGERVALAQAIQEVETAGAVSEETLERIRTLGGEGGDAIAGLVSAYADVRVAAEEVARAQQELNDITEEYDQKLNPLKDQLDEVNDKQQYIKDEKKLADLRAKVSDESLDQSDRELAALEIQEIELKRQIDSIQEEKEQRLSVAEAALKAAQAKQEAAQKEYAAQKASIDAAVEHNRLIAEQIALLERLAKEKEGGAKGGGGAPPMPALPPMPTLPPPRPEFAQKDADLLPATAGGEGALANAELMNTLGINADTLKEKLTNLTAVLGGLVAGFAAFGVISTVVGWFGALSGAIATSGGVLAAIVALLGGPVTLTIAAIAAAVGLFAAAWIGNWGNIQGVMSGVVGAIQPLLDGLKQNFNLLVTNLQPGWDALMSGFSAASPILTAIAAIIGGVVVGALGLLSGMLPGLGMAFSGVFAVIGGIITTFSSVVVGVFSVIIALIQGDWAGAWQAAKDMVAGVVTGILTVIGGLFTTVIGIIGSLVGGVIGFFENLYNVLVGNSIVPDLIDGIISIFSGLPGAVIGFVSDLVTTGISKFEELKSAVTTAIETLDQNIRTAIGAIAGWIGEQVNNIVTAAKDLGGDIVSGIANGITNGASKIKEAAKNAAQSALNAAKDLLGIHSPSRVAEDEVGEPFVQGIGNGILAAIPWLQEVVKGLGDDMLENIADLGKKAQDLLAGSLRDTLSGAADMSREKIRVHDAIADLIPDQEDIDKLFPKMSGFDEADTARLEEERQKKIAAYLADQVKYRELSATAQEEIAKAEAESAKIAEYDAELAADFYKMRADQILELAGLEKQMLDAKTQAEKDAIARKIELVKQAHTAEQRLFQEQAKDTSKEYDSLKNQLEGMVDGLKKDLAKNQEYITDAKGKEGEIAAIKQRMTERDQVMKEAKARGDIETLRALQAEQAKDKDAWNKAKDEFKNIDWAKVKATDAAILEQQAALSALEQQLAQFTSASAGGGSAIQSILERVFGGISSTMPAPFGYNPGKPGTQNQYILQLTSVQEHTSLIREFGILAAMGGGSVGI